MQHLAIDHYNHAEIIAPDRPERWELEETAYLLIMFVHPYGRSYMNAVPKTPPLQGICLSYFMDMTGRTYSVISLLFHGIVRRINGEACVLTGPPALMLKLDMGADLGIIRTSLSGGSLVSAIAAYVREHPPSLIDSSFADYILHILSVLQVNSLRFLFNLLLGILIIRIIIRLLRLLLKLTHIQTSMRYVLTSIAETLMWALLTYTLLKTLGLNDVIYFFTGSIAAIGLAMAAGGSTLISDIVAAIFLARDGDFNVGDEVIAGEGPTQGIIERMDARRTRLRDAEGNLHIIPNSLVERKEWVVVNRRTELGAITRAAKTAKRLGAAALEKRPRFNSKNHDTHENDQ